MTRDGCVRTPVDRIVDQAKALNWIEYGSLLQVLLDEAPACGIEVRISGNVRLLGGYQVTVSKLEPEQPTKERSELARTLWGSDSDEI